MKRTFVTRWIFPHLRTISLPCRKKKLRVELEQGGGQGGGRASIWGWNTLQGAWRVTAGPRALLNQGPQQKQLQQSLQTCRIRPENCPTPLGVVSFQKIGLFCICV